MGIEQQFGPVEKGREEGMDQPLVPNVGPRIRALREQRKLSLRALAELCNLSVNAISLIERGENSPTVSSLHLLATALKVKITDFFEEPQQETSVVFVPSNRRLSTRGPTCLMESLGLGLRNQQLEPFLATIGPAASTTGDTVVHPGQEFVYCLDGRVHYQVGSQTYCLLPGDSLLFESIHPHRFWNAGAETARVLLVFQAAEGSHLARQQHL